jgi:SAM-dependent methyltransferase
MSTERNRPNAVLDKVAALYTQNLAEHGPSAKAIGWRDDETRVLRYEVLSNVLDADDRGPLTTIDWGCGYGGLFTYLTGARGIDVTRYDGYDLSAEMIAAASQLASNRVRLFQSDAVTEDADYAFVSGTFNVRYDATDEQWLDYVHAVLDDLWSHARKGLAFNLLSTYVDWQEPHLFYGDPRAFFDRCKRRFSKKVSLFHDYPLYEWTIVVRR